MKLMITMTTGTTWICPYEFSYYLYKRKLAWSRVWLLFSFYEDSSEEEIWNSSVGTVFKNGY